MLPQGIDLSRLDRAEKEELIELFEERDRRKGRRLFHAMYPAESRTWDGPDNKDFRRGATIYARRLYPKHLEFFAAGATHRERGAICANRVSKTLGMGGYETTCHLTGLYPDWWQGRRFDHPTEGWAAGKTNETTREIVQRTLLGEVLKLPGGRKTVSGTGLIPGDLIGELTWKQGVQNLIDTVAVRHTSTNWSLLGLKSYEQGRGAFEGTAKNFIWLDEEPPVDVYGECLIRTATTDGIVMLTFTPLEGMSLVVIGFLPKEMRPGA